MGYCNRDPGLAGYPLVSNITFWTQNALKADFDFPLLFEAHLVNFDGNVWISDSASHKWQIVTTHLSSQICPPK